MNTPLATDAHTIVVEQETTFTKSVALALPYYAVKDTGIRLDYYAISGKQDNLLVSECPGSAPLITTVSACKLPDSHEQISESVFVKVYAKAQRYVEDKFLASCPSVKAPLATMAN